MIWALLLENVFGGKFLFLFVVLFVIFLVALEDLGVVSHVLLIWGPILFPFLVSMLWILHVEVDRTDIVMIYSVFDIVKIVMSRRHTDRSKLFNKSILEVLSMIFN